MRKFLSKAAACQSIFNSFSELKSPGHGRIVVAPQAGTERTFTASDGNWRDSIKESLQVKIVDALRWGERSKASNLLLELSSLNESLKTSDFLLILKQCAKLPDPLFALETWKLMQEKEIYMGGKCYLYAVRALCRGGYLKEAFCLINLLQKNPDMYPLLPVYNNLLSACAQPCSVNYANDCLDLMEHYMVGKNEITYTELLKLAVLQQNLSAVREIWDECIKCYSLSMISLRKFIWSFTRLKDLESAYAALQHMVALAIQGNSVITKGYEGKLVDLRLDIPIPFNGDSSLRYRRDNKIVPTPEFHDLVEFLPSNSKCSIDCSIGNHEISGPRTTMPGHFLSMHDVEALTWAFSDVIHACAKMENYFMVEQLMSQMQNLGLEPSSFTYDGFISAVLATRGFHSGLEVLEVMWKKNMKPHDSTLAVISVSGSKSLELDLAEFFLDQISNCTNPHPYNALLEACDVEDRPERAILVLAKMKRLNIQPDIRTYELLFSLFANVNAPYEEGNMLSQVDSAKRIKLIEMDMVKNGVQHSPLSLINVIKALGTEGMIKELFQYLRIAEIRLSSAYILLGTPVYNIVLHSLVDAKEMHMVVETFKTMKSCGIAPDLATYSIMIDCCSIMKCAKSAYALVSLMIRDGFCPQAVTYTTLIKTVLGLGDFDEALKLLNQGKLDGIQPDLLSYNTILYFACQKGRIDVIELIVERMRQEQIQPDSTTCSHVFSAYVDQGFYSTAMEALQVLSLRMISEDNDIPEDKRVEFENLVVAEDMETEPDILGLFKEFNEDLATALLCLRWCAVVGFSTTWSPDESQWTKKLSDSYVSGIVHG